MIKSECRELCISLSLWQRAALILFYMPQRYEVLDNVRAGRQLGPLHTDRTMFRDMKIVYPILPISSCAWEKNL